MVIGQPPTTLWNIHILIKNHLARNIYTTVKLKMRTVGVAMPALSVTSLKVPSWLSVN